MNKGLVITHRFLLFLAVILAALFATMQIPTSMFVKPVSVSYSGGTIVFIRETPRGPVTVDWLSESIRIDDGYTCNDYGRAHYERARDNTTRHEAKRWLGWRCARPGTYHWHGEWTYWLWGVVPLRPAVFDTQIEIPEDK